MRSLLAIVVPALLSLHLIACASDDSSESTHVVQNPLVQEGGSCSKNSDCASSLCAFEVGNIGIAGLPAPCNGDNCSDGEPTPEGEPLPARDDDKSGSVKGKPSPEPTPTPDPRGRPEPQPAPAPAPLPAPAPNPTGICIAR
ncbi:MAG: hypothetical protein U0270_25460 [Labilithrix sp.]